MIFRLRPLYAICAVALIGAAAFGAWHATWKAGLAEMRTKGVDRLALHREGVQAAVERYRYLPFLLSQDSVIRGLLKNPADQTLIDQANRYLARANAASNASALYVMDASGLTLAASNYAEQTSFVGESYAFRPYFQDALRKGEGRFYAIGVTTNQPGYFLSHVVLEGERALGVAVVKVDLLPLEATWRAAGEAVAILDGSGVAFLASVDDWTYRPLKRLGPRTLSKLASSRQYGEVNLQARSLIADERSAQEGELVSIQPRQGDATSASVLLSELQLPDHGWTLIAATDVTPLRERSNLVAATTALTLALIGLMGLFLRQRRQLIRAKLEAHAVLEKRVDERTQELRELNSELEREVDVRHRAEEELKRAQGELIQAAKLAALGQMSAAIVHEVSQPLTAIETYIASTRLLLERGSAEIVSANMEIIGALVARMRRMAKSLKAFARKEEAGAETIDLGVALDNAVALMRPRLETERVSLAVENETPNSFVTIHGIRAEQIVVNLIGNAIDAVKDSAVKAIRVRLEREGHAAKLSVADSGAGIPEHLRAHICEPFVTTKRAGDGLGLGLFICDAIINDAGGKFSFADGEAGGAIFTVMLPLTAAEQRWAAE